MCPFYTQKLGKNSNFTVDELHSIKLQHSFSIFFLLTGINICINFFLGLVFFL